MIYVHIIIFLLGGIVGLMIFDPQSKDKAKEFLDTLIRKRDKPSKSSRSKNGH